ncbi:uncharacterized protein B4U80_03227 [Leptotrombidium deliense]|uniref:Uncharacterized protein n=1 Tax=Leptotrombidium deliense TaxID=299467 RepID=A0A443S9S1_9ACAR|nr:uncharacterized protein B4U80_03227 [Leptotrombidium deliense]
MNYRKESGDAWGNKVGSYGIHDIDGRLRIVDYVADEHGFRAKIRTNEPGTANKDAAATVINGPDHAGYSQSHVSSGHVAPQYNKGAYAPIGHTGLSGAYGHAYPHYVSYAYGYPYEHGYGGYPGYGGGHYGGHGYGGGHKTAHYPYLG